MKKMDKLELMDKALNRVSFKEDMNSVMDEIVEMISSGYSRTAILEKISDQTEFPMELYDFARSRVSVRKKFSRWNRVWLDSYSCSYSTPEYIGTYRSERLRGSKLYDMGAGAGMQAIMFSSNSDVIAIERNEARTLMAQLNAIEYGTDLEIVGDDVFKYLEAGKVGRDSVIFSDPLRSRDSEGNVTLTPNIERMKNKLEPVTRKFVFDLPPRTPVSSIDKKNEAEFISSSGSLVRLTEYSSELAESQSAAVLFPSGRVFRGDRKEAEFPEGECPRYLALPDAAIVAAQLEYLMNDYSEFYRCDKDKRRLILGAKTEPDNEFPGDVYSVNGHGTIGQIKDMIAKEKPSKLFLRYSLEPGSYYSKVKELNPAPGSGEPLYVFHLQGGYFLCSRII